MGNNIGNRGTFNLPELDSPDVIAKFRLVAAVLEGEKGSSQVIIWEYAIQFAISQNTLLMLFFYERKQMEDESIVAGANW